MGVPDKPSILQSNVNAWNSRLAKNESESFKKSSRAQLGFGASSRQRRPVIPPRSSVMGRHICHWKIDDANSVVSDSKINSLPNRRFKNVVIEILSKSLSKLDTRQSYGARPLSLNEVRLISDALGITKAFIGVGWSARKNLGAHRR